MPFWHKNNIYVGDDDGDGIPDHLDDDDDNDGIADDQDNDDDGDGIPDVDEGEVTMQNNQSSFDYAVQDIIFVL